MTVQAYLIMDEAKKDAAEALNGEGARVEGQLANNPLANSLGIDGLFGSWLMPARQLTDPAYAKWVSMFTEPTPTPIRVVDSELVFITIEII